MGSKLTHVVLEGLPGTLLPLELLHDTVLPDQTTARSLHRNNRVRNPIGVQSFDLSEPGRQKFLGVVRDNVMSHVLSLDIHTLLSLQVHMQKHFDVCVLQGKRMESTKYIRDVLKKAENSDGGLNKASPQPSHISKHIALSIEDMPSLRKTDTSSARNEGRYGGACRSLERAVCCRREDRMCSCSTFSMRYNAEG